MIGAKLHRAPRYRQVVRSVPLQLGRPVWVDDPHFNLEYHLRHSALPSPGCEADLRRLVGRIMSQRLDRSRPLWELWMIEGVEDGRWAVVSKVHHAMVDGVSGVELLTLLLDVVPDPPPVEAEPVEDVMDFDQGGLEVADVDTSAEARVLQAFPGAEEVR